MNLRKSAYVNFIPGAEVPSLVLSYQEHFVFPENPYKAGRLSGVLETSFEKVEHHVLPSVGAVLLSSYSAWKNEDITRSSFHLNAVMFPPTVAIDVTPAWIATLFGIALLVVPSIPAPPLHLAAVVASAQRTKPAASAIVAAFVDVEVAS